MGEEIYKQFLEMVKAIWYNLSLAKEGLMLQAKTLAKGPSKFCHPEVHTEST